MSDYLVSVCCFAYNHEKYIRETLESFVNQKTNFGVKYIVHDDASTDNTPVIIQEYAEKYPEMIFPVFQKENQYSKGILIENEFIVPLLEGKYVAICEGDDYWTDENKLQIQVDFLEANPDYSMCLHNTQFMNEDGSLREFYFNFSSCDRDYNTSEIILNGLGATGHTSSFMFRSEYAYLPKEFLLSGTGDFSRLIYCSLNGKVRYIDKVMSYYRNNSDGSWTRRIYYNKDELIKYCEGFIKDITRLNDLTDGKYKNEINSLIKHNKYVIKAAKFPRIYDNQFLKRLLPNNVKMILKKLVSF